ncbi:MAG TPA: hypothetical protein VK131_05605 [Candidatus Acidoferrales bacterium]|nr:hypothetical protein [Candidatus Acidoferrales bacterium]
MRPATGQGPSGGELIGLGVFLAAAVVVPLILGIALDGALHSGPLFLFVGLGLGVVAAAAGLYMRLSRYL